MARLVGDVDNLKPAQLTAAFPFHLHPLDCCLTRAMEWMKPMTATTVVVGIAMASFNTLLMGAEGVNSVMA